MNVEVWREPLRDRLARWLFVRMITPEYRGEILLGCVGELCCDCKELPHATFTEESEMTVCETCGHKHDHSMAIALNRFSSNAIGFVADYEGAPFRDTRDEAEADMCAHWTEDGESDAV